LGPIRTGTDLSQIVNAPCWTVTPADFTKFLEELYTFVPSNSVLCLEGVYAPDIEYYLKERPSSFENQTNQGFLRMRPKVYFMPITAENLQGLANLASVHAEPEVCSHMRIYHNETIILSWHDLPDDPFYVAAEIDETAVMRFCNALGCRYEFAESAG
jgi:hypothetical protein